LRRDGRIRPSSGAKLRGSTRCGLQQRRHKAPLVLRSKRHHSVTVDERCERLFLFVRRNIRWHKQHLPQRVPAGARLGQGYVSAMDGVEAAAEKANIHSDIPPRCPVSFVVCQSLLQVLLQDYVPRSPICTSEFCRKHPMRLGCGQGFPFFLTLPYRLCLADTPGRCISGHCAARRMRWTVVTRSARAPRIA
jgi:hypothetical protein